MYNASKKSRERFHQSCLQEQDNRIHTPHHPDLDPVSTRPKYESLKVSEKLDEFLVVPSRTRVYTSVVRRRLPNELPSVWDLANESVHDSEKTRGGTPSRQSRNLGRGRGRDPIGVPETTRRHLVCPTEVCPIKCVSSFLPKR